MSRIVTFGEIMVRFAPAGSLRVAQALPGSLDVTFAGAEANVAASMAMLGAQVDFVTALPVASPFTAPCLANLRSVGIGVDRIRLMPHGRFGTFLVETGANQRPSYVHYDRDGSAISLCDATTFDWRAILDGTSRLHLTGITPGLSSNAAAATLEAARIAREMGIAVSFDINFRSKLWRWDASRDPEQLARETLRTILPFVDLLIAGPDDMQLLGIEVESAVSYPADQKTQMVKRAAAAAHAVVREFPNVLIVASSLRIQHSASHNDWGGFLFDARSATKSVSPGDSEQWAPFEIRSIVDRVGSGDAFDAGILFGLSQPAWSLQRTLDFATAASCLAHSVVGDWNFATREEIETLMSGSGSGRIVR